MIPKYDKNGNLPPGLHHANWEEFVQRFGINPHRLVLIGGLKRALKNLKKAKCKMVFIDGSFVTAKTHPNDFDACWDTTEVNIHEIDPIFFEFDNNRIAQKRKYFGEFFPENMIEDSSRKTFLGFFSIDKDTGNEKGIVAIDLSGEPL